MSSLIVAKNSEELSHVAASMLLSAAKDRLASRDSIFNLMLTGGTTPRSFYQHLAEVHAETIDWSRVRFFWGDERCVPPDSSESNFRMAKESLLDPLQISPSQIFRFEPEKYEPAQAASAYERILRKQLHDADENFNLDYVLLGLGEDGHTASLFPDAWKEWNRADRQGHWTWAPWVPHLNAHRLTVLPNILLSASKIAFLITGQKKAQILKEVLDESPRVTPKYPAQLFVSRAYWLVDQEAAGGLSQAA